MEISKHYEYRWNNGIGLSCRKEFENSKDELDYLRLEYEIWALWIDKFYSGEYGIYNTVKGDAPRYALEDEMDFCFWKDTYRKNYLRRDHYANHKTRSKYIINRIKKLFKDAKKYVSITDDEDENYNINLEEIKKSMKTDPLYKEKWFIAAFQANNYIDELFNRNKVKKFKPKSRRKK